MSDDERKLYVGGVPFKFTKDDLFDMFEKYGDLEDAFIIRDRETGRSRGFGFVIFHDKKHMDDAISALNNTELEGRSLIVERAGRRKGGGGGGGGYGGGGGGRRYGGGGGYRGGGGGGGGYRGGYGRDRDYGGNRGSYGDDRRSYGGGRRNYDDRY